MENADSDKLIYGLFKIIDDIDTGLDMHKTNYKGFQKFAASQVNRRWRIISQEFVDKLYKQFHPKETETHEGHERTPLTMDKPPFEGKNEYVVCHTCKIIYSEKS